MWIYRAYDKYGLPIAEAYRRADLIDKIIEEFGEEKIKEIIIVKIFEKWLR